LGVLAGWGFATCGFGVGEVVAVAASFAVGEVVATGFGLGEVVATGFGVGEVVATGFGVGEVVATAFGLGETVPVATGVGVVGATVVVSLFPQAVFTKGKVPNKIINVVRRKIGCHIINLNLLVIGCFPKNKE
jgi:hypothetical protein